MKHKRLMALLLALAMMITFMPAMAFADTEIEKDSNVKSEEPAETEPGAGEKSEEAATEESDASLQDVAGAGLGNEVNAQTETEKYNLWVGGVRVDSDNASDILKDGHAKFDSTSNTLTLTGATIKASLPEDPEPGILSEQVCGIYSYDMNLSIELVGDNTILKNEDISDPGTAVYSYGFGGREDVHPGDLFINGSGTLKATGTDEGLFAYNNLEINGATVDFNCNDSAIETWFGDVTIDSGKISVTTNSGHGISGNSIYIYKSNVVARVITDKTVTYYDAISASMLDPDECNVTIEDSLVKAIGKDAGIEALGNIVISKSKVTAEGDNRGIYSRKTVDINNSGKGRYSTRVEARATGEIDPEYPSPLFAVSSNTNIKINDNLRIVKPAGGTIGNYDDYVTVFDGNDIAYHVIIEALPSSDPLIATMKASGKTDMNLSWNQYAGADGYDIFLAKCNTKKHKYTYENVASVDSGTTTWTKSGLDGRTAYKAYVQAYVLRDGAKTYVAKSPVVHAYTGGYTKRFTNPKSLKLRSSKLTVKKGKTRKIKAYVRKLKKGKKLMSAGHARKLRYLSTDTSVAKVSKYGKIKGVSKGTCKVYVYTVNGIWKTVSVTVK